MRKDTYNRIQLSCVSFTMFAWKERKRRCGECRRSA